MKKSPRSAANKRNVLYFEAPSMKKLFNSLDAWQRKEKKRLLSVSVQRDAEMFCCIALTNPSEVVIVDGCHVKGGAEVTGRALKVFSG